MTIFHKLYFIHLLRAGIAIRAAEDDVLLSEDVTICSNLAGATKWFGAGGNGYVLEATADCGQFKRGSVAKAYIDEERRNAAAIDLAKLPSLPQIAGLYSGVASTSTFSGKCVHAKGSCCTSWSSRTCYYLLLKHAGDMTLEQCAQQGKGKLKFLLSAAITALKEIHASGFYHGDYQTKNIMFNSDCQSSSIRVIDLDNMDNSATDQSGVLWNKPYYMFRDYAMLFGTCGFGGGTFASTVPRGDNAALALKIDEISAARMDCDTTKISEMTPTSITALGAALKTDIEKIRA
jgi:hypothetical protein